MELRAWRSSRAIPFRTQGFRKYQNPEPLPHRGTLGATIQIDGLTHELFSTRFNHTPKSENHTGHEQSIGIVQSIPPDRAVIFGGDFNAPWSERPWAKEL